MAANSYGWFRYGMNWNHAFAHRTGLMQRSAVRELLKVASAPGMISLAGGLPAPELFPLEQLEAAVDTVFRTRGPAALQYGPTEGLPELRDWVAAHLSRPGLELTRDHVVIVSGAQQGLDLVGRVLLNPGDRVVVENPTYLALLSAWRPLGVEFLPIRSDVDGMRVDQLPPLLTRRPKLIYTTPNFQNPQGTTLSLERRKQLVNVLAEHELPLVEDNPYGDLRYDGERLPHLFSLAPAEQPALSGHILYVGTWSKVLVPGLRLGWVAAPIPVIDKLVQAKQAADLHTSTFAQALVLELVQSGLLDHHVPKLCQAYRARRDAMLAALARHMPPGVTWTHPAGGMFLFLRLSEHLDANEVLSQALEQKVAFVPGAEFHLDGTGHNTLRLNFTHANEQHIEEGIRRLAIVLSQMPIAPPSTVAADVRRLATCGANRAPIRK